MTAATRKPTTPLKAKNSKIPATMVRQFVRVGDEP